MSKNITCICGKEMKDVSDCETPKHKKHFLCDDCGVTCTVHIPEPTHLVIKPVEPKYGERYEKVIDLKEQLESDTIYADMNEGIENFDNDVITVMLYDDNGHIVEGKINAIIGWTDTGGFLMSGNVNSLFRGVE